MDVRVYQKTTLCSSTSRETIRVSCPGVFRRWCNYTANGLHRYDYIPCWNLVLVSYNPKGITYEPRTFEGARKGSRSDRAPVCGYSAPSAEVTIIKVLSATAQTTFGQKVKIPSRNQITGKYVLIAHVRNCAFVCVYKVLACWLWLARQPVTVVF